MKNYIVIHLYHGRTISRWDFGADLEKAKVFMWEVGEQAVGAGDHYYKIVDESSGKTVEGIVVECRSNRIFPINYR